jgi:phage-related protein
VTETGTSVTFTGATDVDPAVIDVQSMTATRDGVDVSGLLSHAGAAQGLLLRPGANTVTLTGGGSVDLTAYGAVR